MSEKLKGFVHDDGSIELSAELAARFDEIQLGETAQSAASADFFHAAVCSKEKLVKEHEKLWDEVRQAFPEILGVGKDYYYNRDTKRMYRRGYGPKYASPRHSDE